MCVRSERGGGFTAHSNTVGCITSVTVLQPACVIRAVFESVLQWEIPGDSYHSGSSKESATGPYMQYLVNCGENLYVRV